MRRPAVNISPISVWQVAARRAGLSEPAARIKAAMSASEYR
jgi:hypothetical protein